MMWKRLIWASTALIGGSFIIWTSSGLVIYSRQKEKNFENDSTCRYSPESSDAVFYNEIGSNWFSFTKNKKSKYYNLLKSTKSNQQSVRHQAVKSIAELPNLDELQCKVIAQECDPLTAVGLARYPNINLSFFLLPHGNILNKENLKEEYLNLTEDLPQKDSDLCVKVLTERAKMLAYQILKEEEDWNSEIEDTSWLFHSEHKRKKELMFDKISLQALLGLSSVPSNRSALLENGLLKFLEGILKNHKNEANFHSLTAQILANIALEKTALKTLHIEGWIGTLALWSKSQIVSVCLPAMKALANLDADDFHHTKYENGIYLLHPYYRQTSKRECQADVIFVHGLLGATFWTWRQHDKMKECIEDKSKISIQFSNAMMLSSNQTYPQYTYCWPKDWLATDFPDIRIISIDYNTCLSKWKADCPQQIERDSIDAKADLLMNKLLLSNVGSKPIIWITHSMGGLIVKHMLLKASASKSTKVNSLVKNTVGVIFFSVPHKGSDLVNFFQSIPYIFQPSIDIGHLQKGSKELISLHEKFKEIVDKNQISVLSFGETRKSKWGLRSMLVSEDSSDPGVGEYFGIPADHLSTCKPESPETFVYMKIVNFLHKNIESNVFLFQRFNQIEYEISNIYCLIG